MAKTKNPQLRFKKYGNSRDVNTLQIVNFRLQYYYKLIK